MLKLKVLPYITIKITTTLCLLSKLKPCYCRLHISFSCGMQSHAHHLYIIPKSALSKSTVRSSPSTTAVITFFCCETDHIFVSCEMNAALLVNCRNQLLSCSKQDATSILKTNLKNYVRAIVIKQTERRWGRRDKVRS